MSFIIDAVKRNLGSESSDEGGGFPDLNYMIGNSSAMDRGEVPTPLDQRIGYAAQIGGSVMELQITNPSTFTLERDKMISTIDQLGIDVTLHSDMNAGYASPQKSGQQGYGYDTVEDYFTEYLQELALFKREVEKRGENGPLFNIGRINPHISTTPLPPLEERMETDVGVDPFGFTINNYDENARKQRNYAKQNIYKNPDFLRKLYYTLFLETANYPFQNYQTFASYSNQFDEEWLEAQHEAAWRLFQEEAQSVEDKLAAVMTTRQRDQGIGRKWLEILDSEIELDYGFPRFEIDIETDDDGNFEAYNGVEKDSIDDLKMVLGILSGNPRDTQDLRQMDSMLYKVDNIQQERFHKTGDELPDDAPDGLIDQVNNDISSKVDEGRLIGSIKNGVKEALNNLWHVEDADSPDEQNISQDAKWNALQSALEVQQIRLLEVAYDIGKKNHDIEEKAARVFSGADNYEMFDSSDREDIEDEEAMHEDLLERLLQGQQFQREMWKESTIFYQVIPAWMAASSNDSHEYHEGWEAPEFIWEVLVEKWNDKDGVEIDLEDPRNGMEGTDRYMDLLEKSDEFQMDVAAAVGACYAWGHFTQHRSQFNLRNRDFGLEDDEAEEVEREGWTWIDWMNRFGIGVNLETMAGSPQQKFKVWRPKDISVAAHAINMTARNKLDEEGELGGKSEIHPELDGCPAKFTIDMEHVASLGAPPWEEMDLFIEQEEELAGDWPELDIDSDKPIAKILRQYHLMDPGVESDRGTHHGAFKRGNTQIYEWLYKLVEKGFARNENEPATLLFELAEHKGESSFMMRISMDMIEVGVTPDELDPSNVDPGEDYQSEKEALIARFFGMDQSSYDREWAKIEEHAFDPLEGLLEADEFNETHQGSAALEQGNKRYNEWKPEEYK
ncbi:hypothetical protein GKQ38_00495 [Candidatus Nanohaloarchaea archaeon]|nr:hypothetical protein GKQ38_00495 [Candidatus Nanohaloarchaea archaeon]